MIDAGCLGLLWLLTRYEGISVIDLVGFERTRLVRDSLFGLALIPIGLVFIFGGVNASGWLVDGTLTPPNLYGGPLPLPAALYGVLVRPFIWGLSEQMTYNGYLVPRFQILCRRTSLAVALVAFAWSFEHVVIPLTFDAKFMIFRLMSPVPFSIVQTLFVSAASPVASVRGRARLDGWYGCGDRRASSRLEGVSRRGSAGIA